MSTAEVLPFPPRPRVLELRLDARAAEYESFEEFEAEYEAMLVREGWTPPPQAAAGASSPPQAEPQPEPQPSPVAQARAWPPVQDFLIVAFGLAAVLLAPAAGL